MEAEKTEPGRREQILRAAARVFAERGYAATMDDIAESIGVTKGSVYHYFASKQDILFELYRRAMELLFVRLMTLSVESDPPDVRLKEVIRNHILGICEETALMTVFTDLRRELSPDQWREIVTQRKKYEDMVSSLIEEGIEKGVFMPLDSKIISYSILGSINWVHLWFRPDGRLSKEEVAAAISEYLVNGLRWRGEWAMQTGKSVEEIVVGEKASFVKTIGESDIYLFAGITGDFNPLHVNEEYAKQTPFKKRIAHGGIATGLISPVLGTMLPGLGTVAVEVTTRFKAPVYIGDTITATAEVTDKDVERNRVGMALTWTNQHGVVVVEGRAVVMPPRKRTGASG